MPSANRLPIALGSFLVACLAYGRTPAETVSGDDPFVQQERDLLIDRMYLDAVEKTLGKGGEWAKGLEEALRRFVSDTEAERVLGVLEVILADKGTKQLAAPSVQALLKVCCLILHSESGVSLIRQRLEADPGTAGGAKDFLLRLAKFHPQLYYKPLFALAAATLPSTASEHLRTVRTLTKITGTTTFWLTADPQMICIVLMGDAGQAKSKGKGKEGEAELVNVRIGRYAVLVEFLLALGEVTGGAKAGSRLRDFLDGLESKLGQMIELQVSYGL